MLTLQDSLMKAGERMEAALGAQPDPTDMRCFHMLEGDGAHDAVDRATRIVLADLLSLADLERQPSVFRALAVATVLAVSGSTDPVRAIAGSLTQAYAAGVLYGRENGSEEATR